MHTEPALEFPMIFSYTRAQAISDGVLIDISIEAAGMGFRYHTVITAALCSTLEKIPRDSGQDFRGRLHDVLYMAKLGIKKANPEDDRVEFALYLDGHMRELTHLLIHVGPGDTAEPVLTIGYPSDF